MLRKSMFVKRGKVLQAMLFAFGIVFLWFAAHWLKNLYLGNLVSYQVHFNATVKVNLLLIIITVSTIRFIWKEFAFTLVELSIVLIIVGFIIAGIAAGTSLVQSSRLNSVITEVRNMQTAILNFRSRYNAVPGDMINAFQYFGSACGDNNVGTYTTTSCNGNGDSFIDYSNGANPPIEDIKFWLHLSLSGVLPNNLTGQVIATIRFNIGQNAPASAYGKGGAYYPYGSNPYYFSNYKRNSISLASYSSAQQIYNASLLQPIEAYSIDNKMDDSDGYRGAVITVRGFNVDASNVCMTGNVAASSASYILTDNTNSCRMFFMIFDSN